MRSLFLLVSLMLLGPLTDATHAQSFDYATNCITNVDNATILLPDTADLLLPDGSSLSVADTVAVRDSDGQCVGYGVWNGTSLLLSAAGPVSISEATGGYQTGSPLSFEVFDASTETTHDIGTDVSYTPCENLSIEPCRDDGLYADGAFLALQELSSSQLPVEFANVTAQRAGRRVQLEWTTAQEVNNAGFNVQHRRKDDPSASWKTLRFVDGAGTTNATTTYTLTTDELDVGEHDFRLQQVDQDGTTALSKNVSVRLNLDQAYEISPISPNPVQNTAQFSITVRKAQSVTVTLYNVLGQRVGTVYDRRLSANDTETIRLSAGRYPSGSYFLRINGETFSTTQRMTVVQ